MSIGENIKKYRREKNMTQAQLAQKVNKSESTIQKYERNSVKPDFTVLDAIAEVLDVPTSKLLEGIYDVKNYDNVIKHLNEVIQNIEKSILQEGYNPNLNYMKGNLDGLKIALKILINESEEI